MIAYLGRDVEDAVRLGVLKENSLPKDITEVLGSTNSEIVNTIIFVFIAKRFVSKHKRIKIFYVNEF